MEEQTAQPAQNNQPDSHGHHRGALMGIIFAAVIIIAGAIWIYVKENAHPTISSSEIDAKLNSMDLESLDKGL